MFTVLIPSSDPFLGFKPTPSQRATLKYFYVVVILWGVQILMGVLTAHYGVEGQGFYGFPLDKYLPYAVTRTWHLQIAIFWIATSWLATGLYVGPAVSGHEPKYQRLGVNALFGALILVVGGSLAGEWLGIQQRLGNMWFWLGSQGYEYVDLGRLWQILLFVGLVLWLVLMVASLKPALVRKSEDRALLTLFLISSIAIPLFYSAGLMYGQRSHLVTAEYWRWWVVHLWVEGFFEVFATVVIGFLFTRLKLIEIRTATKAALFSTTIFLSGGIIGTFHHLYFAGATPAVIGLGAIFSAFEVVPLTLIGYEAWENIRLAQPTKKSQWIANYKWPIYFFVAVAFWNLVGAGLFGFLINPPISLYYVQGLNLTPVHGHTALFGVYGMLGLGLTLFCLRALKPGRKWKETPLKLSFWSLNFGLIFMVILSMLPVGLAASLGIHRTRHLVCAFLGVHAVWHHADSALDESSRRHSVRDWSSTVRLVRAWIANRPFVQQGETRGNGRFVALYQRKARRSTRWSLIYLATFHAASLTLLPPPKTPCALLRKPRFGEAHVERLHSLVTCAACTEFWKTRVQPPMFRLKLWNVVRLFLPNRKRIGAIAFVVPRLASVPPKVPAR